MPLYEYECADCHASFTDLRSLAERENPADCRACGTPTGRPVLSAFAVRAVSAARPASLAQTLAGTRAVTPSAGSGPSSILSGGCQHAH